MLEGINELYLVGPVHTQDNGPGYSGAGSKHAARQNGGRRAYLYALVVSVYIYKGASTPLEP